MTEPTGDDEASILWAAAVVHGVDPDRLISMVDVGALAAVVAEVDAETHPVDAAAALLVAMVRRRPFSKGNAAIGWLATVHRLADAQQRVDADPADVVKLCDAVRRGEAGALEASSAIGAWVIEVGIACPTCGRRVYADDALARRLVMPSGERYELTARCAFEHGSHDRSGRPIAKDEPRRPDPRQPVLAAGDCGSFLVAGDTGPVVVTPFCDDPPLVQVVEVVDLHPGDLVGRWDSLIDRSTSLGVVPAHAAEPDERGEVDMAGLRRALRASRRHSPGHGVRAAGPLRQEIP